MSEHDQLTLPTIHLNGTSRKDLLAGYREAHHALEAAWAALARTCPHGRDYYPQGPQAINDALAEHEARLSRLRAIRKEIERIAFAVMGDQS